MTGVIYARYSEGPRQTDQSIEGQVADCKAYAEQHGIDILNVYADRHISGKSVEGRDAFRQMIRDAEKHLFNCVIVWKIDRFGRSREDIAINKMKLRKAGVYLYYAKESVPEGPEGILMESLLEGLAEYYSADLRQKIIRGQRESAKKGKIPFSKLPIGYVRNQEGRVIIDAEKAEAVREIYSAHIAGATLEELNGILRRYDLPTSNGTVHRILHCEHYTGHFNVHGVDVEVDPIITPEMQQQAIIHYKTSRNRKHNAAGKARVKYLLSCKCYCAKCGKMLRADCGTGKSGKKYHYYSCPTKGCQKPKRQEVLEDLVLQHTMSDILTDDMIEELTRRILAVQEARNGKDPAILLEKKLKGLKKRQNNIIEAIENGGGASLVSRLNDLEDEISDLELEIEKVRYRNPAIPEEIIRGWLLSFKTGNVEADNGIWSCVTDNSADLD